MAATKIILAEAKKQLALARAAERELQSATKPEEVIEIEAKLDGVETWMQASNLFGTEDIRPVNETRMRARWKLGKLLAVMTRGQRGPLGKGKGVYVTRLQKLGLSQPIAVEAQRIAAMPDEAREAVLAQKAKEGRLTHFVDLVEAGRSYWYQASRKAKHKSIAEQAAEGKLISMIRGPYPLIYADPPWKFQAYSDESERLPDQHYPTMTYAEIAAFEVDGKSMSEIAGKKAALFLWCTTSNLHRALEIMDVWGFDFKSSAAWDKMRGSTGLVFRNWHELILYGTRGAMPGPQYQPPSLFRYPRGKHSAKPPEIRKEIERMYPDFDARTRLEVFARDTVEGWTSYGFEAHRHAAE